MVTRTRLAIIHAFNNQINQRDFEDITVSDIANEAQVSKATFYRYFKDKYDVMNTNYKEMVDEALLMDGIACYRDLFHQLYRYGETRLRPISGAFRSTGANSFENYIYDYSRETIERITMLNRDGAGLTEEESMQVDVFCYGICHMYKKWITGHYKVDANEAADRLFEMMPETLRDYWLPEAQEE